MFTCVPMLLISLLLCCVSGMTSNELDEKCSRHLDEQGKVIAKLVQQQSHQNELISQLNMRLKHDENVIREQKQIIREHNQQFVEMKQILREQNQSISSWGKKLDSETRKLYSKIPQASPDTRNEFSSYGCLSDILTMSCPDSRTLFLTTGVYGQYTDSCASCCVPGGSDCTELIEENRPSDWAYLKLLCDNETSCSYEYKATLVNECEEGYVADYMLVYYDCYPLYETEIDPVGFTAYATDSRQYDLYEIVQFDGIVTNYGEHYDSSTSKFLCPHTGIYMFSANMMAVPGYWMYVQIIRDGEFLVEAWADDLDSGVTEVYQHGSALVITQCNAGQEVWGEAASDNSYMAGGSTYKYSHFSGYLLYRFQ